LAIDFNTGDLLLAPNKDFDVRTGTQVTEQRIRVRLKVRQGEWVLDPSDGQLGSRLLEIMRLPRWRAEAEAELAIREALEPMEDIQLSEVIVSLSEENSRALNVTISYLPVEEDVQPQDISFTTTLTG
jgi:hypothetical protein